MKVSIRINLIVYPLFHKTYTKTNLPKLQSPRFADSTCNVLQSGRSWVRWALRRSRTPSPCRRRRGPPEREVSGAWPHCPPQSALHAWVWILLHKLAFLLLNTNNWSHWPWQMTVINNMVHKQNSLWISIQIISDFIVSTLYLKWKKIYFKIGVFNQYIGKNRKKCLKNSQKS